MACKGSLIRTFPAHGLIVPLSTFADATFQVELAAMLSKLDSEVINEMMPKSKKAGSEMAETRDTANPALATEMLMAILASVGKPLKVQQIKKRTRDDVLWDDCLIPWRRSALWLTLKVAIQTTLTGSLPFEDAIQEYKNFMALVSMGIGSSALASKLPSDLVHVIFTKIARRIHKLGPRGFAFIQRRAMKVCREIDSAANVMWKKVQDGDADRQYSMNRQSFAPDTTLSLINSKTYLDPILSGEKGNAEHAAAYFPICPQLLEMSGSLPTLISLPIGSIGLKDDIIFALAEFNCWIKYNLPAWIAEHIASPRPEDCTALAKLAKEYLQIAGERSTPPHLFSFSIPSLSPTSLRSRICSSVP